MMINREALVVVVLTLSLAGCGEIGDSMAEVQQTQSELHGFGSWTNIPNGFLRWGAAVAGSNAAGTVLFGIGTDNEVYSTRSNDPGGFGAVWRKHSSFGALGNMPFISAVGFINEPNNLLGQYFALAYTHPTNGKVYIQIQDQTGNVLHGWDPIPSSTSIQAASLVWLPSGSLAGSQRVLGLIAIPATQVSRSVWTAGNNIGATGGYDHTKWSGFTSLPAGPVPNGGPFGAPPGVTWAAPLSSTDYSMVVAVMHTGAGGTGEILYTKFNGSAGGWSPWTTALSPVAFPFGSIGLTYAQGEFGKEIVAFCQGSDNRVWFSTQIHNGPATFTQTGTRVFQPEDPGGVTYGRVSAGSSSGRIWFTEADGQIPVINSVLPF